MLSVHARTNFSELDQPHDRYERAPTRGRPSAGPWGNRWQTRRINSLNASDSYGARLARHFVLALVSLVTRSSRY